VTGAAIRFPAGAHHVSDLTQPERPDLDALVAKWAPRVCPGWRVSARYASYKETDGDQGSADYIPSRKINDVLVLDPEASEGLKYPDVEETLVHELLHGPFYYLRPEPDTVEYTLWEQLIEDISVLLVQLDRKTES
jgi:hypothetical protein